ncbi:MAG: PIN domain-containing protein [Planctomycetota bacterium]
MSVFVDTSALLAVLDADDDNHPAAAKTWRDLLAGEAPLFCTNYVLLETIAVAQRRLGMDAVRTIQEDLAPLLNIAWVDESAHQSGMAGILAAGKRDLSLVDGTSFHVMRQNGIKSAFVFDRDFEKQGFDCLP